MNFYEKWKESKSAEACEMSVQYTWTCFWHPKMLKMTALHLLLVCRVQFVIALLLRSSEWIKNEKDQECWSIVIIITKKERGIANTQQKNKKKSNANMMKTFLSEPEWCIKYADLQHCMLPQYPFSVSFTFCFLLPQCVFSVSLKNERSKDDNITADEECERILNSFAVFWQLMRYRSCLLKCLHAKRTMNCGTHKIKIKPKRQEPKKKHWERIQINPGTCSTGMTFGIFFSSSSPSVFWWRVTTHTGQRRRNDDWLWAWEEFSINVFSSDGRLYCREKIREKNVKIV